MKTLPNIHPGEVLLEEFLKPMALSQNVDRNVIERGGDENVALMPAELLVDRFLQRAQELCRLGIALRRRVLVCDQGPAVRIEWDLASLPSAAANLRRRLQEANRRADRGPAVGRCRRLQVRRASARRRGRSPLRTGV